MHSDLNSQQNEALQHCITRTELSGWPEPYRGKVREVYELPNHRLGIVVTDRISAFDHIMRRPIPYKGQILNQLAAYMFRAVDDLVDTHLIEVPHPNVSITRKCEPLPVEVVVRGYLAGHAWREYRDGKRELCGVPLPEGMVANEKFDEPILTPATKAREGHDEDISEQQILDRGMVEPGVWEQVRNYAFDLFDRGTELAHEQGLILVDTKYEFGLYGDQVVLIDEVHTPDSSRYFYSEEYYERLESGEPQNQLSKEFLREWLMEQGFQGKEGQQLPDLPDNFRWEVFKRYAELYETLTGRTFEPTSTFDFNDTLKEVLNSYRG